MAITVDATLFTTTRVKDYFELTKFRLVSLVLLSTAVGFILASEGPFNFTLLFAAMMGTSLVATGSMALNQWMEHREDAKMIRTQTRPIPAGKIQTREAFLFGLFLSGLGLLILKYGVNTSSCFLASLTLVSYIIFYTPLKKITSLCTIVGAVPGALPPLIGWVAVSGRPSYEAWVLFAIIFLWQMPHFLAIAWLYRKDFEQAGFKILSTEDPDGKQVARQILLYSSALLPVSLLPSLVGVCGFLYFFGALALGMGFVGLSLVSLTRLNEKARALFRASILHLALLLILMVLDKT